MSPWIWKMRPKRRVIVVDCRRKRPEGRVGKKAERRTEKRAERRMVKRVERVESEVGKTAESRVEKKPRKNISLLSIVRGPSCCLPGILCHGSSTRLTYASAGGHPALLGVPQLPPLRSSS